ncbi:histidine phosphatase family protein [Trichococcus patagoniensis]|nr:histidine phosphatase family protein [Trichococcus patagoniensis]
MRHGETRFNVLGKVQGSCDSPLTPRGIEQAKIAGQYFLDQQIVIDHAYASTQERACDTLEFVIGNEMPYERLKALKEMDFGHFEGENARLQPKGPEYFESFYANYGGEAAWQVRERMVSGLTAIMERDQHQHVLAVSHNGACFYFLQSFWQGNQDDLRVSFPNCCIFQYTYENKKFVLERIIEHDFSELG